jgi:hypothetical protein
MVVDVGVRPGLRTTGEQRTPLRNGEDADWLFVVNDRNTGSSLATYVSSST